jgi:hypothetical protein
MLALDLVAGLGLSAAETGTVLLDFEHPGVWQSDGMWQVTPRRESVEFLKDERPAQFEMPAAISRPAVSGRYANHADGKPYTYRILYSLDGQAFEPAAVKPEVLAGDGVEVGGEVVLPAKTRRVWVSYTFPICSPGVVVRAMSVELTVAAAPGR